MADEKVKTHNLLYGIDDKPPVFETGVLGLQHYLTMFGSTLAIPLLLAPAFGISDPVELGWLIATMFFVSGITTHCSRQPGVTACPLSREEHFPFWRPQLPSAEWLL